MSVANRDWRTPRCSSSRGLPEPVEQALACAEGHRGDDDRELVDQPRGQSLADEAGAAHHVRLLAAGCCLGLIDRLGQARGKDEVAVRRLACAAVGDDEERDAPGVLAAPVPGRLVRAAARDHRTVRGRGLLQPGRVLAGRLPAAGRVVAAGPAEHPMVRALAAGPQPAARAVAGPGDQAAHRDGDPREYLAIGSLPWQSSRRRRRDVSGRRPARAEIIARPGQQHGLTVLTRSPRPPRPSRRGGLGPGQPVITGVPVPGRMRQDRP